MATIEERERKAAHNQSLMREVNERIVEVATAPAAGGEDLVDFLCECYDAECIETLSLPVAEYEAVRENSRRFPVKPGHVLPDVERVVDENGTYIVVEKIGQAGQVTDKFDPRRRQKTNGGR